VETGIGLKDMFSLKITIEVIGHILQLKKHTNIATNISSWAKSFGTHSQSQLSSHYIPSGAQEMQSQTALVASKSLTLSPIHIMTISVINSMTGCRLYDLSKPLLMRMSELKQVCIKEQVPSHEVKVTQRMNEHVPGVICHSVSPTGIG